MDFRELPLTGCFEIIPNLFRDERGSFVKTFHCEMFRGQGLETEWREEYYSLSRKGVLRGMHFQTPPHDHNKLVYCTAGSVLDVVVDLRRDSATFGRHAMIELNADSATMLYIPKGFAHGFYTLSDNAAMMYKVSSVYAPAHDVGILWNSLEIPWPETNPVLSARDAGFPPFSAFDIQTFPYR